MRLKLYTCTRALVYCKHADSVTAGEKRKGGPMMGGCSWRALPSRLPQWKRTVYV